MKKNHSLILSFSLFLFIFLIGLAACTKMATDTQGPLQNPSSAASNNRGALNTSLNGSGSIQTQLAMVDDLEVNIVESYPAQVKAIVKGNFRNGCEYIDKVDKIHQDKTFTLTVFTKMKHGVCIQTPLPFQYLVTLDVAGLLAGTYEVFVHNVRETFELKAQF